MVLTKTSQEINKTQNRLVSQSDTKRLSAGPFHDALERFPPITLAGLGRAVLLDRQETKYLFSKEQVLRILPKMLIDYQVLEIRGARVFDYKTSYYDTPQRQFFQQHMRGAGSRWKVRQRTYLDSNLSFLEVKHKDNRKRTRKTRMQLGNSTNWNTVNLNKLIQTMMPCEEELVPVLDIWYTRTTLVNQDLTERITLDQGLVFRNGTLFTDLSKLMIAEVKQASFSAKSPFFKLLKEERIYPSSFSKYCVGTILTNPEIKHNRYKPVMRRVCKITAGGSHEWTH